MELEMEELELVGGGFRVCHVGRRNRDGQQPPQPPSPQPQQRQNQTSTAVQSTAVRSIPTNSSQFCFMPRSKGLKKRR